MADLEVDSMSDDELRSKLAEHGFPILPITSSTRNLLANKLKKVLSKKEQPRYSMDFRAHFGRFPDPAEASPERQLYSDAKIQGMLCQQGFPVMPITATTRGFYIRLLGKRFCQKDAANIFSCLSQSLAERRIGHVPRNNREQLDRETIRNFEALRLGGVPNEQRISQPRDERFEWLEQIEGQEEQNESATIEANERPVEPDMSFEEEYFATNPLLDFDFGVDGRPPPDRTFDLNMSFEEFLLATTPRLDLGAGVFINNTDIPVISRTAEVTAEPEVVPPRPQNSFSLRRDLSTGVVVFNDTGIPVVSRTAEVTAEPEVVPPRLQTSPSPRRDLSTGVVINNTDIPVVYRTAEVTAEPDYVPPKPQTSPSLKPSPLQCRVCLDNDTSMVMIPCGHMICGECRPNVISCPFCRSVIIRVQIFFL